MLYSNERSPKPLICLQVAARASPLSRVQFQEVFKELQRYHTHVHFDPHFMQTLGDRDQVTSLRSLDKTDFFTRDIDQWVLQAPYRIGIHSAKDLPSTLAQGLAIFCLTKGVDPSDALVLREETLDQLPFGACIATSSVRREESVRQLREDFTFCDIRGTIEQRLQKLENGDVHGVVIAEAALIRLGLTHLPRVRLPGSTVEGQGQLAVVGREEEKEIQAIFQCLDVR